jgi:hypothetical protein
MEKRPRQGDGRRTKVLAEEQITPETLNQTPASHLDHQNARLNAQHAAFFRSSAKFVYWLHHINSSTYETLERHKKTQGAALKV